MKRVEQSYTTPPPKNCLTKETILAALKRLDEKQKRPESPHRPPAHHYKVVT